MGEPATQRETNEGRKEKNRIFRQATISHFEPYLSCIIVRMYTFTLKDYVHVCACVLVCVYVCMRVCVCVSE